MKGHPVLKESANIEGKELISNLRKLDDDRTDEMGRTNSPFFSAQCSS